MPIIPALERLEQEDFCELEARMNHKMRQGLKTNNKNTANFNKNQETVPGLC